MPYILALLIEDEPGMTARTRSHVVAIGTVLGGAAQVTEARRARLSMTMRTPFAGEQVAASTATTEGVYDYAAHKGQMDTTIKTAGIPFRFTVRTLVIGSTVYIKTPDMPHGQETPAGVPLIPEEHHKPWAKLDLPKELAGQNPPNPGPVVPEVRHEQGRTGRLRTGPRHPDYPLRSHVRRRQGGRPEPGAAPGIRRGRRAGLPQAGRRLDRRTGPPAQDPLRGDPQGPRGHGGDRHPDDHRDDPGAVRLRRHREGDPTPCQPGRGGQAGSADAIAWSGHKAALSTL